MRAQHLGDVQREVCGGNALAQLPGHVNADDLRREKIHRLAEHSRFRLDPADAPADDTKPVDHRRMRIGSNQCVRVEKLRVAIRQAQAPSLGRGES